MRAAPHKCSIRRDAGRTKANDRFGEGHAYCCIFFSRGCCSNGADCTFLHRIPNAHDEARLNVTRDIFGRERHNTDKQDMRGTGNFNRESRTLYIGGLILRRGTEEAFSTLLRHLSEWGDVEQLRMIPNKAIAFVTYKLRSAAEFALEAMHCQTLELDELLNVRWAYDDPNPRVRAEIQAKQQEILREAVAAKGYDTSDAEIYFPSGYAPESANSGKRGRGEYPDTDGQYDSSYAYLSSAPDVGETNTCLPLEIKTRTMLENKTSLALPCAMCRARQLMLREGNALSGSSTTARQEGAHGRLQRFHAAEPRGCRQGGGGGGGSTRTSGAASDAEQARR